MMNKLYRVEWNGGVMVYIRIKGDWFSMETVTASNEFEDFRLKDVEPTRETIQRVAKSELSETFLNKELAKPIEERKFFLAEEKETMKAEAKRRWDEHMAPRALYDVVRYWDDILDMVIRRGIPKREARKLADNYNKNKAIYNHFSIVKQKKN